MRNEDDTAPAPLEVPQDFEEAFHLRAVEGRCRFVEDEERRLAGQRLHDLDELTLVRTQTANECLGGKLLARNAVEQADVARCALPEFRPVDEDACLDRQPAKRDVFPDGSMGSETEFLIEYADAVGPRRARSGDRDRLVVDKDPAAIGPDAARNDLAERALSRAVGAHEDMDLARHDLEVAAA